MKCSACDEKETDVQRESDPSFVSETIQRREVCDNEGVCRSEPDPEASVDQNYSPAPYLPYKTNDLESDSGGAGGASAETPYRQTGQLTGGGLPKTHKSFSKRFKECMSDLGLPTPTSLFSSYQETVKTISVLTGAVNTFGKTVTVSELVVAGSLADKFAVLGALGAAFYLGAATGCLTAAGADSLTDDDVSFKTAD